MELVLTDQHRMTRDMARAFAIAKIAPAAAIHDEMGEFPNDPAKMSQQGFTVGWNGLAP